MEFKRYKKLLWAVPVLLALLINQNVLQNGYGWDDQNIIHALQPPHRWVDLLSPLLSVSETVSKENTPYFRPVVSISYGLDNLVWGNKPFGFHFSVWAAHILNTALVFFLARGLMPGAAGLFESVPLLSASLFAVHPAHVEAVAWIAGRNDVFCTCFILISMVLYIRFHRTRKGWIFILSMLSFSLALLTKETAVGFILLFPLYEYLTATEKQSLQWRPVAVWLFFPVILLGLFFWIRNSRITMPYGGESMSALFSSSTAWKIIAAYGYYFKLLVFPYPHRPFIEFMPGSGLFIALAGFALVLSMVVLYYVVRRRQVLLGIGLAWTVFLLAPAVAVAVLGMAATPLAERYAYAPSAGFCILAGWLIIAGIQKFEEKAGGPQPWGRIAAGLILVTVVMVWGVQHRERNTVWKNPVSFWQAAAATSPDTGYPYRALGVQFALLRRNLEAEQAYQRAIAIDEKTYGPDHQEVASSLNNLAVLYFSQGDYAKAEPVSLRSLAIWERVLGPEHPNVAMNLHNLGVLNRNIGRYDESRQYFERALAIEEKAFRSNQTPVAATLENYAVLLRKMNRGDEAEKMEARAAGIRGKQAQESR